MNKFTTLMALAAMVFAGKASATVYNGQLQVNVNGSVSEQAQPITIVTNGDECTLSINNFCLTAGGEKMGVGNIVLKGNKNMWTLLPLKFRRHIFAGNGESGGGNAGAVRVLPALCQGRRVLYCDEGSR